MSYIMNPRLFYINSRTRLQGTDSDFTYQIDLPQSNDYDSVCMLQCMIPKSFYLIQSGYNTFTLVEGASSATITIPAGNYSNTSFQTVVKALLNAGSPHTYVYNITFPSSAIEAQTGKFTYTVTGNSGSQPSFVFTTGVYEQMGFSLNSTNTFVSNSMVSTNVLKFQVEDSLFIHSDIVGNEKDDVLQEVYLDTPDFANITFSCPDVQAYSKRLSSKDSNSFYFRLTDENKIPIGLNGINMVFTLLVYKKDPIFKIIKKAAGINILSQI